MPGLNDSLLIVVHDPLDFGKLASSEAQIPGQTDGLDPEPGREIIAIDVDVRRLVGLVAVEVEPVGPVSEDGRHTRQRL